MDIFYGGLFDFWIAMLMDNHHFNWNASEAIGVFVGVFRCSVHGVRSIWKFHLPKNLYCSLPVIFHSPTSKECLCWLPWKWKGSGVTFYITYMICQTEALNLDNNWTQLSKSYLPLPLASETHIKFDKTWLANSTYNQDWQWKC